MTHVVTGGAGFIGSWTAERLVADGASVAVVDDLSTGRLANLDDVGGPGSIELVHGDARDRELLARIVERGATVIHLAALVGVEKVCEDPARTYRNNLESTRAVLDVAATRGCRVFVASSSEVYGDAGPRPVAEDDTARARITACGRGRYRQAKLEGERLSLLLNRSAGLEVVVGRLFNTVGPRQRGDYGMVVPRLIDQAAAGEPMTVIGDGTQVRTFCDVRDTVDAILGLSSDARAIGQVFNVGGTEPVSILELAEQIRAATGSTSRIDLVERPPSRHAGVDVAYRQPDIRRIGALTGWSPRAGWRDVVRELAAGAVLGERVHA